jgi:hypothetical protein
MSIEVGLPCILNSTMARGAPHMQIFDIASGVMMPQPWHL